MTRYSMKIIKQDGTETRQVRMLTRLQAEGEGRAAYQRIANQGERCTVKIYADGKLVKIFNRHNVEGGER